MLPERDDNSYLSKPLIPDTEFIIEDDRVKISTADTIYVHANLSPPIEKERVLALYKRVLALAKEKKISISYSSHIRRSIRERWGEYAAARASMKALFPQIITQSRVVKERGLHYGTTNDRELEKLQRLCWDYQRFHYGGSVVSLVSDILHRLECMAEDLSEPEYRWDRIIL